MILRRTSETSHVFYICVVCGAHVVGFCCFKRGFILLYQVYSCFVWTLGALLDNEFD